jgi:class 3 adenylate cyclase
MEPRIQYAQTKDGVSIAFWAMGEGTPLVGMTSLPFSHIQLEWQQPGFRHWYEALGQNRKLVRFDCRGSGLSDRDIQRFSLDGYLLDLEAVVERLGMERFALFGVVNSGPVAIAYAARHPEQISHLILWCSWARASDYFDSPQVRSLVALRDKDWEIYTETVAHALLGWSANRQAFAAYMQECVTQETALAVHKELEGIDVTALLSQVRSPTLVLHRRQISVLNLDVARRIASRIPDAQLVVLEGTSLSPWEGDDVDAPARAIDKFLGAGEEPAAAAAPSGLVTILFTDVEGSTALTDRLGDAKARELLREHERTVREALKTHGGSEVKTMGDGFMTSFSSATKALECAITMQRAFAAHNESAEEPIKVRVGLNAGEPIAEDEDLFGTAVNLAARVCAHAEAGQILAPIVVRELAAGKQFMFADLGETELRGFEDPVRLYELRWREAG